MGQASGSGQKWESRREGGAEGSEWPGSAMPSVGGGAVRVVEGRQKGEGVVREQGCQGGMDRSGRAGQTEAMRHDIPEAAEGAGSEVCAAQSTKGAA